MGVRGDGASPRSTRHGAARLEDRGGEGEPATSHRGGSHEGSVAKFDFWAKSKNRVSRIQ